MKKILTTVIIILILCAPCLAQKKGTFMRVFDSKGKKIYAGRLAGITDSSFSLVKNKVETEIAIKEVKYIKLKHSVGHPMLIAGGASAVGLAIALAASAEPDLNDGTLGGTLHDAFNYTAGQLAATGFLVGAAGGSLAGAIIGAAKKKHVYIIDNDIKKWALAKKSLTPYLLKPGK
ncbi:MAG: hypothetical protein WKF88_07120 [Ferruginibacter sp.]